MAYNSWGFQTQQQPYSFSGGQLPQYTTGMGMGTQPNYNAPSSQWNPPPRGTTSSFGNTSGLAAGGWSGGWGAGSTTFPGLNMSYGGGDPTSTADVNRPPGYGSGQGSGGGQQQSSGGGGGSGQTSPNPDPYGQPWVDYINADGTPHINYQYGNPGHHGGGGGGAQTSGEGNYWFPPVVANPNSTIPNQQVGVGPNGQPGYQGYPSSQQTYPSYGLPFDWQKYAGATPEQRAPAQEWAQMALPYQQFMQNALQYGMDFEEAKRRWDAQFGYTQQQDAFSQMMAMRQQAGAEQVAQYAQGNWLADFAHQSQMDNQNYGLQRDQFGFTQEMGRGNLQLDQGKLAEQVRAALAQEGFQGQELELKTQQVLNQNAQYYAGLTQEGRMFDTRLNQENTQFNKTFGLDSLRNTQQYGLQQQQMKEQVRAQLVAEGFQGQELELKTQQVMNQNNQYYAGLAQEGQLAGNELSYKYAGLGQEGSLAREQMGLTRQLSADELAYKYAQLGQGNDLARWQTGQELGFGREQLQAETQYKYANLQEQARQFGQQYGLDAQQVQNTAWYQQQQAAIEREQLAQQYQLQSRGYGIQEAELAQTGAISRERMMQEERMQQAALAQQREAAAYAAFGRAQNPNARWLRAS